MLDAGVSPGEIRHRIGVGYLAPIHRSVYAVGHTVLTPRSRWMAAVLAAGVCAVLSHRSAAALWGVHGPGGRIEVTAPVHRRIEGLRTYRCRIHPDEKTVVDGIPATGISRTLLDLAATAGKTAFEAALRQAEYRRLTDDVTLADLLARYPRRPGSPLVRAALDAGHFGASVTRSGLEDRFLSFLDASGLPFPVVNGMLDANGRTYEADAHWPEARLIAELDDPWTHGTATAFESDRSRDRALLLAGWRTIRVTDDQIRRHPDRLAADLRALLGAAAEVGP